MADVDNNLFSSDILAGNLATIPWLVNGLGWLSVRVISVIGFSIVVMTIMKNSGHGLYAVNPKFWDRVDEVHRTESIMAAGSKSGNEIGKLLGVISVTILSIIPNLKALTDFDDCQVTDPASYFIKGIPVMCVQVFIGVFIYFSYPAQVAEKYSTFSRGFIDCALNNIDPLAFIQKLPDHFFLPQFSTDGSITNLDNSTNKVSKKVWSRFVGQLSDIKKESKEKCALQVEDWVSGCLASVIDYTDVEKYDMSVTTRISSSSPDLSHVNDKHQDGVHTYAFACPIDNFDHGSATSTDGLYIRFDLTFTELATKSSSLSSASLVFNVADSLDCYSYDDTKDVGTITISTQSTSAYYLTTSDSATCTISGSKFKISYSTETGKITVSSYQASVVPEKISEMTDITGLKYVCPEGAFPIKKVTFSNSGRCGFSAVDSSLGITAFTMGESPKQVESSSSSSSGSSSSSSSSSSNSSSDL